MRVSGVLGIQAMVNQVQGHDTGVKAHQGLGPHVIIQQDSLLGAAILGPQMRFVESKLCIKFQGPTKARQ